MTTPRPEQPIKLHRHPLSGHCHRVELLLSLLDLPYQTIDVDLLAGAHKKADFLALNVFGQVPVIEDDGLVVADSNAILVYLATRYDDGRWLPRAPGQAAEVQRWLSVAAGPLAHGPGAARLGVVFGAKVNMEDCAARAHALFATMEKVLGGRPFLTGSGPTIADLALYAYTARAPEGKIPLGDYPSLRSWLARIEALPRFVPMPQAA
jgi:glutathione S-transferase